MRIKTKYFRISIFTFHDGEHYGADKDEYEDEHKVDHNGYHHQVRGHVFLFAHLVVTNTRSASVNLWGELAISSSCSTPPWVQIILLHLVVSLQTSICVFYVILSSFHILHFKSSFFPYLLSLKPSTYPTPPALWSVLGEKIKFIHILFENRKEKVILSV